MKLIFEKSVEGRRGVGLPSSDVDTRADLPEDCRRGETCPLPEVSELEVVRHFTELSRQNFGIDTHFYPLGSCTMKYNPKFIDEAIAMKGFTDLHPLLPQLPGGEILTQGALEVLYEMDRLLSEITGMACFTMQPLAGAHGELTGVMMMAAYHRARGNHKTHLIVPDSSHGTNPATAAIAGYEIVSIPSDENGVMDPAVLEKTINDQTAGLMPTCPNTHGVFNAAVDRIAEKIHAVDGLMYYDGANLNAILGRCRPGDIGFDVTHINLHKTFATPHGGGGPGAGPVGVSARLEPYLPISRVTRGEDGQYRLDYNRPDSIGYIAAFYGNFSVILRAYAYILLLGAEGLKAVSDHAVLNANYLRARLKPWFTCAYDRPCMHEVVFSADRQAQRGVKALDIAKFLIDQGVHPPTVYFPLTVKEALMIEPTETEAKQALDFFIDKMRAADELSQKNAEAFDDMPRTTPVCRPDEVKAARELDVNYFDVA